MYLKYNDKTGQVADETGATYFVGHGIPAFQDNRDDEKRVPLSTKDVISLKEQGFDAKEIIEMRKEGVL